MATQRKQIPISVVYKKRKHGKSYIQEFTNIKVDDILSTSKRNPPIPHNYEILDIGVGAGFKEKYKQKYKL